MSKRKPRKGKGDLEFTDPHLTKQDHGGMADISFIASQYMDGALPYPENPPAFYGDISAIDVSQARDLVALVESNFAELPSDARATFHNDAERYVGWLEQASERINAVGIERALYERIYPPEAASGAQNAQIAQNVTPNEGTEDEPAPEGTVNPT